VFIWTVSIESILDIISNIKNCYTHYTSPRKAFIAAGAKLQMKLLSYQEDSLILQQVL